MYALTIFKNTFDNKTHRKFECNNWDEFESLLKGLSLKPGKKGGSNSSPLISAAIYKENTTRANDNVICWKKWCAVDVDDIELDDAYSQNPLQWIQSKLKEMVGDYRYVCYSTASSKVDNPKFRVVFPLTDEIESNRIKHFWFAINSEIQFMADKQTKDLSRMFYVPATYPGAYNFFFINESDNYINPDELMAKWPFAEKEARSFLDRLPEALRKEVVNYRKESLDNFEVHWTTYRDCPFFPKQLATEYQTIQNTGWYHKMYQIMIAIAGNAVKRKYPITSKEVADLCKQFDQENGNWYANRPLEKEADRAIEWVYRNGI